MTPPSTTNAARICSWPIYYQEPSYQRAQNPKTRSLNLSTWQVVSRSQIQDWKRSGKKRTLTLAMQVLTKMILQGWPNEKSSVHPLALPYFYQRDELTLQNGLIFRGERVVVPKKLRETMKQKIHSSHMGAEACLRRARECIYWPGMCAEMKQLVESCETCRQYDGAQPKETLRSSEVPKRPWERIATDLFSFKDKDFLITVDYYSNFWEID